MPVKLSRFEFPDLGGPGLSLDTTTSVAARYIAQLDGKVPGIYVTINPVDPRCRARASNHLEEHAQHTTPDNEILQGACGDTENERSGSGCAYQFCFKVCNALRLKHKLLQEGPASAPAENSLLDPAAARRGTCR
jgi:hypothetical protein